MGDGTLGWFYPVYVRERLSHLKPKAFWDSSANAAVIDLQVKRREAILAQNKKLLNRKRFGNSSIGRNEPCPCGSGEKFKHCCGSY